MSGHPRKLIRQTVKDIIANGNTLAGKNVFTNKKIHIDSDCLPQIVIHTESENVELLDQAPKRYKRDLTLTIEIFASAISEDKLQDDLDQMAWQIENLLADDDDWNGTVNKADLTAVRLEFQETGTNPIGACILTYTAQYLTDLPEIGSQVSAELTDLDAIQGLAVDGFGWDIIANDGEPDGAIDAELLIETVP